MASTKRLRSVCHSLAHHAVSAVSYLQPHLKIACRQQKIEGVEIDLKSDNPCPQNFRSIEPLQRAISALKKTFISILKSEKIGFEEISSAKVYFDFPGEIPFDEYSSNCRASLTSVNKRTVEKHVNFLGFEIDSKNRIAVKGKVNFDFEAEKLIKESQRAFSDLSLIVSLEDYKILPKKQDFFINEILIPAWVFYMSWKPQLKVVFSSYPPRPNMPWGVIFLKPGVSGFLSKWFPKLEDSLNEFRKLKIIMKKPSES